MFIKIFQYILNITSTRAQALSVVQHYLRSCFCGRVGWRARQRPTQYACFPLSYSLVRLSYSSSLINQSRIITNQIRPTSSSASDIFRTSFLIMFFLTETRAADLTASIAPGICLYILMSLLTYNLSCLTVLDSCALICALLVLWSWSGLKLSKIRFVSVGFLTMHSISKHCGNSLRSGRSSKSSYRALTQLLRSHLRIHRRMLFCIVSKDARVLRNEE